MGAVPPLGWNSWCTDVSCTKDYCDEKLVHTQVDAIVKRGLRDMGCQSHRPCLVEPSCHPLSLQTRARTHAHSLVNTCTHRHHCATTTTSTITVNTIITTITTITTTRARAGEYITLDDCWGGERHQNGSYWWDEDRFPSGIPALARQFCFLFITFGLFLAHSQPHTAHTRRVLCSTWYPGLIGC